MSARQEHIPDQAIFQSGELRVMNTVDFGWVILLRETPESEEEAFTIDEVHDNATIVFEAVRASINDESLPQQYRDFVAAFLRRYEPNRHRTVH